MEARDVADAERLYRLAFGTYFQLPDPLAFRGDACVIEPRWRSYPDGGVVALAGGAMIGLCFVSNWGGLAVLGPVAVHPDHWRHGVARQLLGPALEIVGRWRNRITGLFTFPQSAQHLRLYQDFGFWPRHLTPVLAKPLAGPHEVPGAATLSARTDRAAVVAACRELTESVFAGLDLSREIADVVERGLGDTILLFEDGALAGFAVCHTGAGSEGGSQACFVKFALVRSGGGAAGRLRRLVAACENFAHGRGVGQIAAGVSTGRHDAYRTMVELGFRMQIAGVTMHRPHAPGYDRPDVFALEDWR
ncbi:MAG TPA: GNAT family N-acetyltransferase [Stellaceae bacterium]|nr:GNAT family N-acetyltransferase [Stellaceae bacterium]